MKRYTYYYLANGVSGRAIRVKANSKYEAIEIARAILGEDSVRKTGTDWLCYEEHEDGNDTAFMSLRKFRAALNRAV